jgi:hypothetical protein
MRWERLKHRPEAEERGGLGVFDLIDIKELLRRTPEIGVIHLVGYNHY